MSCAKKCGMTFNEYQKEAFATAKYPENGTGSLMAVVYTALGMGESGEVQGKIKKIIRDNGGRITEEIKDTIKKEMGDCLWYVAAMATELGITLDEVASRNLEKLADRCERDVISGSGDER